MLHRSVVSALRGACVVLALPALAGCASGAPLPRADSAPPPAEAAPSLSDAASPPTADPAPPSRGSANDPAPRSLEVRSAAYPPAPSWRTERARAKGWGYLIERLAADGLDPEHVARAFADPRMPVFDGLLFSPRPRERRARYRHFLSARSVARATRCAAANAEAFAAAERAHGVAASVVAAILYVESACGTNTGRSPVLHRLARLAMANEPANVRRNLERAAGPRLDPDLAEAVRERARYLEGLFHGQVLAVFEVARQAGVDPLAIRGSRAGAFGSPQFLPLSYVAFGTDGNADGRVSLDDPEDAAASCARFLASHGWHAGLSGEERRGVLWHYNRSDAYVDAVLGLAERIAASGALEAASAASAERGASVPVVPASAPGESAAPVTREP